MTTSKYIQLEPEILIEYIYHDQSDLLVADSVRMTGLSQVNYESPQRRFVFTTDDSNNLKLDNGTTVPPGGIIMWNNEILPDGFVLCDGCTYETPLFPEGKLTPDLRNKFPIGATPIELNSIGAINSADSGTPFITFMNSYQTINTVITIGLIAQDLVVGQEVTLLNLDQSWSQYNGNTYTILSKPTNTQIVIDLNSTGNDTWELDKQPRAVLRFNFIKYYGINFIMYVGSPLINENCVEFNSDGR